MIKAKHPTISAIGLDVSPTMLRIAQEIFAVDKAKSVDVIEHDLNNPLLILFPEFGTCDVIVTSLTIHHLTHQR
jgi:SAM-dependent methyltransferase